MVVTSALNFSDSLLFTVAWPDFGVDGDDRAVDRDAVEHAVGGTHIDAEELSRRP